MRFKDNVRLSQFKHLNHVIDAVDDSYMVVYGHEALMTSANDSKHSIGSKHYTGEAWDFRIWVDFNDPSKGYLSGLDLSNLVNYIMLRVGINFDVISKIDHIHVEYDPK